MSFNKDGAKIPWSMPWIDRREKKAVLDVLNSEWLSMGKKTSELERKWADLLGAKYAIAVSNGTLALEIALATLGIGVGDEVIVPAMTYIATASAVIKRGATPKFADIERDTFNLDPSDLSKKISSKTKAIIYIDYGGIPAKADAIMRIASDNHICVLQDAAQTIGTSRNGKLLGFETGFSVTSFHAAKLVTTIEGGMIFTNNHAFNERIRLLRNQGEDLNNKYHHIEIGFNARITDLQSAIGLAQLVKLKAIINKRRKLALYYNHLLSHHSKIELPQKEQNGYEYGWFFYPILINNRDKVATALRKKGIDTRIAYPMPLYRQECFRNHVPKYGPKLICPVAEEVTSKILNLPIYHTLQNRQQERIVREILTEI